MRSQRQWYSLLVLCLCSTLSTALECYSRNKINAKASKDFNETLVGPFVDCKKDNGPTTCCLQGQYCDADLLCHTNGLYGSEVLSRQYCSDPEWPEGSCSEVCPVRVLGLRNAEFEAAGVVLTPCDNTGEKFCCGPSSSCCEHGNYTQIDKNTGRVVAIGTSTVPFTSTATATGTGSSTAGVGASATSTSSTGGEGGDGNGGGLSEQSKLGIGLGVGLGVPFFIAIGAALFLWKRSLAQNAGQGLVNEKIDAPVSPGSGLSPGYETGYVQVPTELGAGIDNKPVHQLEANPARAELGSERVYEMGS